MADVNWPASLPNGVILGGGSEQGSDVLASWAPGPWQQPLRRKRASSSLQPVTYVFRLSDDEMATFRTFWTSTLAQGVNNILIINQLVPSASMRLIPTQPYSASYSGRVWDVTITALRQAV